MKTNVTHVVSYWYIPGRYDYVHAEVRIDYCYSEEEANWIAKSRGIHPPEMAIVLTIEEYNKCKK